VVEGGVVVGAKDGIQSMSPMSGAAPPKGAVILKRPSSG